MKRQTGLTMSPAMWAYIERLRATGLYGESTSAVLRNLISSAVQKAVADGLIELVKP